MADRDVLAARQAAAVALLIEGDAAGELDAGWLAVARGVIRAKRAHLARLRRARAASTSPEARRRLTDRGPNR